VGDVRGAAIVKDDGEEGAAAFRTAWWQRLLADPSTYELTRFAILRLLAFVQLFAFLSLACQFAPLLGSDGLLPATKWLADAREQFGAGAYWRFPTVFWFFASDGTMQALAWVGVALSAAALAGVTNAILELAIWVIYLSFVHVGQTFYAFGWELQLLETTFLAVLLCPVRSIRPLLRTRTPLLRTRTPVLVIWLFRWLAFRIMVGAALIKLRNDPCWRDLTCLDFHFETQPNPNPLSIWFHRAPHLAHAAGVVFNHLVELVAPFFAFGPRRARHAAGALFVLFQVMLIASGNLSFLNWLTIVPALACFDDSALLRLLPKRASAALGLSPAALGSLPASRVHARAAAVFALVVAVLSVGPVMNLLSSDQAMNANYDPLDLVNTYGAFGSVDRERFEVILEGTDHAAPSDATGWREYELPCMPGDPRRRPCLVGPYHYRLDWQMWFVGNGAAAGEAFEDEPWLVHLVWKLLRGDPTPKSLLVRDPFPQAPPRWMRASVWRYRFARRGESPAWWVRERVGDFLTPLSRDDVLLRAYVQAQGWNDADRAP
jgi:hypothetical protein